MCASDIASLLSQAVWCSLLHIQIKWKNRTDLGSIGCLNVIFVPSYDVQFVSNMIFVLIFIDQKCIGDKIL